MAHPTPHADLNVTPLIDILLVLLVIFMATLPLKQRGLDSQLPAVPQDQAGPPPPGQIVLEYTADRHVSINHQGVALDALQARLEDLYADRRDKTMFLIGDGSLAYGDIVAVIDAAKGAGVNRVGIVTEGMRRAAGATK